jgi:hypothetical protein
VSTLSPGPNFFGSGAEGHFLNSVVKFTGGSRVLSALTPHSGTGAPPTSPSPTFFTVTST